MRTWTDEDVEIGMRAARANARREALEEAAKVCEAEAKNYPIHDDIARGCDYCAEAIRALIDQKPPEAPSLAQAWDTARTEAAATVGTIGERPALRCAMQQCEFPATGLSNYCARHKERSAP